jgi:hypothetical protein
MLGDAGWTVIDSKTGEKYKKSEMKYKSNFTSVEIGNATLICNYLVKGWRRYYGYILVSFVTSDEESLWISSKMRLSIKM